MCEKMNVEWSNQSFGSLISELKSRYFNPEPVRRTFSKKERSEWLLKCGGFCQNGCPIIKGKFHLDHIVPLASNGTNNDDNIQLLCTACHDEKTKQEQTEVGYVKLSETASSFNTETKQILNSPLCSAYAFAENVSSPNDRKVYHIDINRCRKNEMYFKKQLVLKSRA